jgi:pyruvate,water dikinase
MGRTTITDLFGGRQDAPAGLSRLRLTDDDLPRLRANRAEVIGRTLLMLARFAVWREPAMRRLCERVRSETMGFMAEDVAAASDSALVGRAMLSAADLVRAEPLFEIGGAAVLWQGVFLGLCRRWLGESAAALASRLLAGLGNNANAQAGQDLWALAVQANAAPAVRAALDDCAGFDAFRGRIAGVEAGRAFLAAWDDFMRRHGHHARGELEAANPRWSETPDDMLDQVRACARAIGGEDFAARYRRLRRERAAAWAECRRRLRDPIRRAVFRLALDRAQRLSPMRENIKSDLVRQIAGMRRLLLELGRRWAAAGRLDRPDDIFFLRLDELARFGEEAARDGLRADVQARRREYAENQRLTPPPVVVGRYDPALDVPAAEAAAEGALTGVPVHPGVVAGPARVILRSGADTVRPGEILVAPFTDPGWTPYFLNAAAIVVDMGGVLSHGSIIAREYGIPMVANVGYATRVFRTGDRIIVDGSRGVVQRGRETRGHDILLWRRGGGSNIISPELKS